MSPEATNVTTGFESPLKYIRYGPWRTGQHLVPPSSPRQPSRPSLSLIYQAYGTKQQGAKSEVLFSNLGIVTRM